MGKQNEMKKFIYKNWGPSDTYKEFCLVFSPDMMLKIMKLLRFSHPPMRLGIGLLKEKSEGKAVEQKREEKQGRIEERHFISTNSRFKTIISTEKFVAKHIPHHSRQ